MMKYIFLLFPFLLLGQGVANFDFYSVGYDDRGTNWVSYRLTKEMVELDTTRKRVGFFKFNKWSTKDYTYSGYDRGHLAPAHTFSFSATAYYQTFSMANVVPMVPSLNRQTWRYIEVYEKEVALKFGCILVFIEVEYGEVKIGKLTIPIKFTRTFSDCSGKELFKFEFLNI